MGCRHYHLFCKSIAAFLLLIPLSCALRTTGTKHISPQMEAVGNLAVELKKTADEQKKSWQLEKAERSYQDLIRMLREKVNHQHPLVASALNDLGDLYRLWGKYSLAEPLYGEALEIQKKSAGSRGRELARTVRNQAVLNQKYGRYDRARKLFRQSASILELESNTDIRNHDYAQLLTFIGNLNRELGEYRGARHDYERALGIQKLLPGNHAYAISNTINNLATISLEMGAYRAAESTYAVALSLTKDTRGQNDPEYARTLGNLAYLNQLQGKYGLSKSRYVQALTIQREALGENHMVTAEILNNMAALSTLTNDYGRAEQTYIRSRRIIESILGLDHHRYARSLNNLGQFYRRVGDYHRADRLFEKAHRIMKGALGADHPQLSYVLYNIGLLRFYQKRYEQASDILTTARAMQEKAFGADNVKVTLTLYALGKVHRQLGHYARAESLFETSLKIQRQSLGDNHVRLGYTLNELALLYAQKTDYVRAESVYQQAMINAILNDDAELLWKVQHNLSRLLVALKKPRAAVVWGKQAVNTIQNLRAGIKILEPKLQDLYLQRKEHVYRSLAGILIDVGRIPEAEQVIFLLKDFEYRKFMKNIERRGPGSIYEISCRDPAGEWCRRFKEISGRIIAMGAEHNQLDRLADPDDMEQAQLEQLVKDLALARDVFLEYYFELKNSIEDKRLADRIDDLPVEYPEVIQTALRETKGDAIWLNYVAGDDQLDIIVTASSSNTQVARHHDIGKKELRRLVATFREAIDDQEAGREDMLKLAKKLYQIIIEPVSGDLFQANANLLVVSLDDSLNYLPLAALHNGEQFLIEKYSIAIFAQNSEANLAKLPARIWKAGGLGCSESAYIIDNELGLDDAFPPLKSVEKELQGIIKEEDENDSVGILKGESYLNDDFTVDALRKVLKDETKQVVHIATHFEFNSSRVDQSYLVIGGDNFLSLKEIYQRLAMPGGKDLLALSACETGLINAPGSGAEIEGLGAMMLRKGARSVLATLWKVNDLSTALLMQNFYKFRQERAGRAKVDALREAQLALLYSTEDLNYQLPYHWAPFILMGNWF